MDLTKSYEYFQPEECDETIFILGCGAIGSTLAEMLVRLGLTNIVLYDHDIVTDHNIANQLFVQSDVGLPKVEALFNHLIAINPQAKEHIIKVNDKYTDQNLSGYVFLCVDNVEVRREIVTLNMNNTFIKAMFDFRMRLEDAQHYAADWRNRTMVENFIASMQFSHEEAQEATPVSACNLTLSVAPTVRVITALGVANFMNFIRTGTIRKLIVTDPFHCVLEAF